MRCILCDRCRKIVEDERKIKVVTYARPLNVTHRDKCVERADNRQMNELIWTMEICPSCAEQLENFMNPDESEEPETPEAPEDSAGSGETSGDTGEDTE